MLLVIGWGQSILPELIDRRFGSYLAALVSSPPTGMLTWMDGVALLWKALPGVVMLLAIRLSPVAGYHAGEHQTVWAIERGEPLIPEVVAKMPRPHPRCGTNLVVGLMLFWLLLDINPYLAFIVTILFWRKLGHFVQEHLTTRTATRRQIESGIAAAKELLGKYRENPQAAESSRLLQRVWNMGIVQTLLGYGIALSIANLVPGLNVFR